MDLEVERVPREAAELLRRMEMLDAGSPLLA